MIDPGIAGRVALVTGANNPFGIGAGVARALATQGAKVFLHYFRETETVGSPAPSFYRSQQRKSADEVLRSIHDLGQPAFAWEADLSDAEAIPGLFDQAERQLGPVEILVNNAAYWEGDTLLPPGVDLANRMVEIWACRSQTITAGVFDRIFSVNTRAAALMMAEFARRHLRRNARWGRIINISTDGAECFPSEVTYGASKLALESYSRSAAVELGKYGVTVNVLPLGPVQTGWITAELEREILPNLPLGRIGTVEDVADVVVFLASEQGRWVTGQRIFVGGGHRM